MSKELYFTDGNNEVKYLDTTASFNLAITQDGSAFDLTNAKTIDVKVANDTGYVFDKSIDMATIKQPLAGLITMPVDAEVMNALVPDDYTIEVWVTLSSLITPGSQEGLTDGATTNTTTSTTDATTYNAIFPSDDPQGFTITENVMSDSGDVIPVMSLDEFQQEFDQLKTDLTNKVATLQGPQGIPGKTGTGVSSTTIQYQISNSATTTPTGTWSNTLIATTQVNPFLWMQATLNYDDGTSKSFYLVSSKGDKGDKGDTGPVGSGLVVKGTVKDASQLPKDGNQEGYCYFVGTDLYVWDAGEWKNCGSVSPDLSNYVTATDLNNGLSTKVTDNKNGTEQLNGVQVQPFNKLSDTIGGRNVLLGTQVDNVIPSIDGNNFNFHVLKPTTLVPGKVYTFSAEVTLTGSSDSLVSLHVNGPDSDTTIVGTDSFPADGNRHSWSFTCPTGTTLFGIIIYAGITGHTARIGATWHHIKIEQGSIATDWTPAPEDKADDSKVVHSTDTSNWQKQAMFNPGDYKIDTTSPTTNFAALLRSKYNKAGVVYIREINGPSYATQFIDAVVICEGDSYWYAYGIGTTGNFAHRQITPSGDTGWVINADDSKVVHNSGNEEIAGQKTFDVAPIDKTTGNPYITKSDVTTAISTATANMVDSSKPTNFTAGLKSGGVDVATAADLKSIKDASWYTITGKSDALSSYTCLYRKNNEKKYVDLVLYGTMGIRLVGEDSTKVELLDLSGIINSPTTVTGLIQAPTDYSSHVVISGTELMFSWDNSNVNDLNPGTAIMSSSYPAGSTDPFLKVTFN